MCVQTTIGRSTWQLQPDRIQRSQNDAVVVNTYDMAGLQCIDIFTPTDEASMSSHMDNYLPEVLRAFQILKGLDGLVIGEGAINMRVNLVELSES